MTKISTRTMIQYKGVYIKGACLTCLIPPTFRVSTDTLISSSSSLCLACCAAFTNTSVARFTALPAAYRIIVDVTFNSHSKHKKISFKTQTNPPLFSCLQDYHCGYFQFKTKNYQISLHLIRYIFFILLTGTHL